MVFSGCKSKEKNNSAKLFVIKCITGMLSYSCLCHYYYFCNHMSKSEYQIHTLSNGIRLIHKSVNSPVSHLGLFINTGSRDELPDEHGWPI